MYKVTNHNAQGSANHFHAAAKSRSTTTMSTHVFLQSLLALPEESKA